MLSDVIHIVTPYLALAYLKGDSAKAAKMYVPPEAFTAAFEALTLNPFELKSTISVVVLVYSTSERLAASV